MGSRDSFQVHLNTSVDQRYSWELKVTHLVMICPAFCETRCTLQRRHEHWPLFRTLRQMIPMYTGALRGLYRSGRPVRMSLLFLTLPCMLYAPPNSFSAWVLSEMYEMCSSWAMLSFPSLLLLHTPLNHMISSGLFCFFSLQCPDRLWSATSLLSSRYPELFPRGESEGL
jgi:hypothetical protein